MKYNYQIQPTVRQKQELTFLQKSIKYIYMLVRGLAINLIVEAG